MDIEKLALQEGLLLKTTNLDLCPSYIGKLSKFAEAYHQANGNEEIQTLRAKVASAEVLVEALRTVLPWVVSQEVACNGLKCRELVCQSCDYDSEENAKVACEALSEARDALATYDKLSEVKHDTK